MYFSSVMHFLNYVIQHNTVNLYIHEFSVLVRKVSSLPKYRGIHPWFYFLVTCVVLFTKFELLIHVKFTITYGIQMEKAMGPHTSTLAWKIPWTEEPGGLQSLGSRRVGHDWATSLSLFTFMHWRRKWQPTPVFLPGESQGWESLVGCRLWGCTESDTTEVTQQQQQTPMESSPQSIP